MRATAISTSAMLLLALVGCSKSSRSGDVGGAAGGRQTGTGGSPGSGGVGTGGAAQSGGAPAGSGGREGRDGEDAGYAVDAVSVRDQGIGTAGQDEVGYPSDTPSVAAGDADAADVSQVPDAPLDTSSRQASLRVQGAVQKGPFVIGSQVQIAMIDDRANPTGIVFNTQTRNDLGEFDVTLPGPGEAEIITSGFYFNEISGALSQASIGMHALAELSAAQAADAGALDGGDQQQIYVNAVTHMSVLRAKALRAGGMGLTAATRQAETELKNALGVVQPVGDVSLGTGMNALGGDTDANAYLFGLSCILANAAKGDAELQQLINLIALDLEDDGKIDAALGQQVSAGESTLDAGLCMANMQAWLAKKPGSLALPNIDKALDFDKDGIADFYDTDADGDGVPGTADLVADVASVFGSPGCAALGTDGEVWSCNRGDGPSVLLQGIDSIAAASGSSLTGATQYWAVKHDGTVWTFSASSKTPTQTVGVSNVRVIGDGGGYGSFAIKRDGTLSLLSASGGTASETAIGGFTNVRSAAGNSMSANCNVLAVIDDGTVRWGGCSSSTSSQVTEISNATAVVGAGPNYVLVADGSVWYWSTLMVRSNGGPNDPWVPAPPTLVAISNVVAVSAGAGVLLATKTDGTVWVVQKGTVTGQVSGPRDIVKAVAGDWCLGLMRDGQVVRWPLYSDATSRTLTTTTVPERVRIPR